ncbi:MAG TPA: peptidylprolyl isomerase [Sedimentisphaerales bacterium]|nr:peptidylprolyl isomerase [Sedimentisphaerales bacterium]
MLSVPKKSKSSLRCRFVFDKWDTKGRIMAQVKSGDTVRVHYTGKLDDGTVFASSSNREPLQFTIGEERIIPALEQAVVGMSPGEAKTAEIVADEAYGPHYDELVRVVNRSTFPAGLEPEVGQRLNLSEGEGREIVVTVVDLSDSDVTLDANHPLAGEDLTFDIQLVEIV